MSGNVPEKLLTAQLVRTSNPVENLEWLDRHRWLAYLALSFVPFLVALPLWIFHLSLNPVSYYSGVVQHVRPGVIHNGLPFGDPNVGWTSQALGHLAAWQWIHGKVPWWNPYSGIGVPLAGELQPGAFFLPFVLLLLLRNGFVWLRIAMQLVAGFSTFGLLRELELGTLAALMGGVLFELNGTFAFTPGPASVFCSAAFLPLLLLGIEQVSKRERERTGTLCIALGLALSLLAGFPEVAYIDGLLALLWSVCRFVNLRDRWRFALRLTWGGMLGLLLSAPLLVGFWSLLKHSSAFEKHARGLASLPLTAIPSVFVPYIYGPFPGAFSSPGKFDVWGSSSYAGLLLFFLALLGLLARRPLWLRALLIAWVALCGAKNFGVHPVMSVVNHVPFLLQTVFSRYSPASWTLCLVILAAFALEELRYRKLRLAAISLLTLAVFLASVCIAWPWRSIWGSEPVQLAVMSKYFIFGASWSLAGLVCALFLLIGPLEEKRRVSLAGLLALNFAAFFVIPLLSAFRPGSVDRPAIRFLQSHLGLSRFYTLGPIQPNYSAYFQMAGIDYVSFPVPESWYQHVANRLFPQLSRAADLGIFWPAGGWFDPNSGVTYLNKFLSEYEALGVRYVVADSKSSETLAPSVEIPSAVQGNRAMVLQPGQQVEFSVPVPAAPAGASNSLCGFAILLGNFGNTADGELNVRLCAGSNCAEGSRSLSESADNSFFYVPFTRPLDVAPGISAHITLSHVGGGKPAALWLWPALPRQEQHLLGLDGKILPGKALRVSFSYDSSFGFLPNVYHDSLLGIFELPHPAPYYSIAHGGPCRLDSAARDFVHAVCSAPALLVRRELYMPGWNASFDGGHEEAKPYGDIFQSFDLPRGDSHMRFGYAPPRATLATFGALLAAAALFTEFALDLRRYRWR